MIYGYMIPLATNNQSYCSPVNFRPPNNQSFCSPVNFRPITVLSCKFSTNGLALSESCRLSRETFQVSRHQPYAIRAAWRSGRGPEREEEGDQDYPRKTFYQKVLKGEASVPDKKIDWVGLMLMNGLCVFFFFFFLLSFSSFCYNILSKIYLVTSCIPVHSICLYFVKQQNNILIRVKFYTSCKIIIT